VRLPRTVEEWPENGQDELHDLACRIWADHGCLPEDWAPAVRMAERRTRDRWAAHGPTYWRTV
jgi:hypothetical protein